MKKIRMAHFLPCAATLALTAPTANAQDTQPIAPAQSRGASPTPWTSTNQPPVAWRATTAGLGRLSLPLSPGVAKKTAEIVALRRLHQSRFTLQDIEAAHNHLKELRDAEKAMLTRAEKLLDDERRALLSAGNEEEDVPDSARKIQIETETYREKETDIFRALRKAITPAKADVLEEILGRRGSFGSFEGFGGGFGSSAGFGRDNRLAPPQPSGQRGRAPSPDERPRPNKPSDSTPAPPSNPPTSAEEEERDAVVAALAQREEQPPVAQSNPRPEVRRALGTPQINSNQSLFGRTAQGFAPLARFPLGMTLPLSDLVDLLQQKRNAMKR